MMKPPRQVAIIGLGLIGASLGMALRRLPRPPTVVGFDLDPQRLRAAHSIRAFDRAARSPANAVEGAELVIVATPVRAVEAVLREVGNLLPEGAVVTDTGSTKAQVVEWAHRLPPRVGFVGGHPMTGKLSAQVDGPDPDLFTSAIYCLTPEASTPPEAVEQVVWLVEAVGGVPYFLQPDEHDALVALVSHLPFLLSSTLMDDLGSDPAWREMSALAAGGLLAATALAESDPRMFADICLTNREHLVRSLGRFMSRLEELRAQIAQGDEGLFDRFARAQRAHAEWIASRQAAQTDASNVEDLRPPNPFLGGKLSDLLKGKRPPR